MAAGTMKRLPASMCAEMTGRPAWYAVQTAEFMERTAALELFIKESNSARFVAREISPLLTT